MESRESVEEQSDDRRDLSYEGMESVFNQDALINESVYYSLIFVVFRGFLSNNLIFEYFINTNQNYGKL